MRCIGKLQPDRLALLEALAVEEKGPARLQWDMGSAFLVNDGTWDQMCVRNSRLIAWIWFCLTYVFVRTSFFCVNVYMRVRMNVCMDGWMHACMYVCTKERTYQKYPCLHITATYTSPHPLHPSKLPQLSPYLPPPYIHTKHSNNNHHTSIYRTYIQVLGLRNVRCYFCPPSADPHRDVTEPA